MAAKSNATKGVLEKRRIKFMDAFSREAQPIRDALVKDLPAYNQLLNLNAFTFQEFALQQRADDLGILYNASNPPMPLCPHCNSDERVGTQGEDRYRCNACDKSFTANNNSISSGTKCDATTWMKLLLCLLEGRTITQTMELCDIARETYYNLRSRILYGMQILLRDVKYYGVVEVDNTFVPVNYKGYNLDENEFEEDSIFYNPRFIPREARKRGGSYSSYDRNANSVCIFTAIDEFGHVMTRFAGIGVTNYLTLEHYIPQESFLLSVPKKDPFAFTKKVETKKTTPLSEAGSDSLMVSDMENAIEKYANRLGIKFESHVFRRNNVQVRLKKGEHDIQRVNAVHRRLKAFLAKHNYASTKYLPGFLILFEFIENTGASDEAIGKLFKILSTPGLGKSDSSFFDNLYIVPNYLVEWLESSSPLRKIPDNKLLAYYLYDKVKNPVDGEEPVTMKDIISETGYSEKWVRKSYNDLTNAGYRPLILNHFSLMFTGREDGRFKVYKPKVGSPRNAPKTFNPTTLQIFDDWVEMRKRPFEERLTIEEFVELKNKEYNTNYKRTNLQGIFKRIVDAGLRPPLPKMPRSTKGVRGEKPNELSFQIWEYYNNTKLQYRQRGEKVPNTQTRLAMTGEHFSISPFSVQTHLGLVTAYKTRLKKEEEKS